MQCNVMYHSEIKYNTMLFKVEEEDEEEGEGEGEGEEGET